MPLPPATSFDHVGRGGGALQASPVSAWVGLVIRSQRVLQSSFVAATTRSGVTASPRSMPT